MSPVFKGQQLCPLPSPFFSFFLRQGNFGGQPRSLLGGVYRFPRRGQIHFLPSASSPYFRANEISSFYLAWRAVGRYLTCGKTLWLFCWRFPLPILRWIYGPPSCLQAGQLRYFGLGPFFQSPPFRQRSPHPSLHHWMISVV